MTNVEELSQIYLAHREEALKLNPDSTEQIANCYIRAGELAKEKGILAGLDYFANLLKHGETLKSLASKIRDNMIDKSMDSSTRGDVEYIVKMFNAELDILSAYIE